MPETFHLPPGAIGIDHWSGRSFPADGNGHVTLPDHIANDMKRNGALRHYDVISGSSTVRLGRGSEDDPCQGCGFNAWEFTATCPRCGHDLAEQRATQGVTS